MPLPRQNNFDSLRLIAALVVILSHAVPLTTGNDDTELFIQLSHGQTTAGTCAVVLFFVMSGYLITASYLRTRSVHDFLLSRALRLWPALSLVLLVSALAVGPAVSSLGASQYFHSFAVYRYIGRNLLFRYAENLPAVFAANPVPSVMNGSLWTLKYEVACYLLILALGICGLLRRWVLVLLYAACLLATCILPPWTEIIMIAAFLGGAVMYVLRPVFSIWLAAVCLAGWMASFAAGGELLAAALFAPPLVLYAALSPSVRLPRLARYGDLSYGAYILAFPVQQSLAALLPGHRSWWLNALLATATVLILAFLSWHFVEGPSLRLKTRLLAKKPQYNRDGTIGDSPTTV